LLAVFPEAQLADEIALCYADPLRFVLLAYPWGETGPLKEFDGPDKWQTETLKWIGEQVKFRKFNGRLPVAPIRSAISSGHGIGKSTLVAWLVNWIMSTRPHCKGTVTANTFSQLEGKTWAQIRHWTSMCITGHWFKVGSQSIYHLQFPASWRFRAETCREENSEAFAGQHAADSSSVYIFDEASAIPDRIWEVAEGGLTDGEPMIFAFGNPTRNSGKFYRVTFGADRDRWVQRCIDSRDSAMTNKAQIAEWIKDYGEDSDFVRVRVRGLPPGASDLQFIDSARVYAAQKREAHTLSDEPLVAGLDLARGGADNNVIRFRRGLDAKSIPPIKIRGEEVRDSTKLVSIICDVLGRTYGGHKIHTMFADETGVGGPIIDRVKQLGHRNIIGIQFGGSSPDRHFANMRSYMWAQMKEWLDRGAVDKLEELETDLTGPGFHHDKSDRLILESKENMKQRGLKSPDNGDALALTFAQRVAVGAPMKRPEASYSQWA